MLALMDRENPTPLPTAPSARLDSDAFAQQWQALAAEQEDEDVYLCELAGVSQLSEATSLQAVINTSQSTVSHLGAKLPNLQELNLSNSVIESLRDLGSGFRALQVLWVSRCGLSSLDGISAMSCLRELYCAYNDVSDLQPLGACTCLEVLDLEGNCVQDVDALDYLGPCSATLQALTVTGNPMMSAGPRGEAVRHAMRALPALQLINDQRVATALIEAEGASDDDEEEGQGGAEAAATNAVAPQGDDVATGAASTSQGGSGEVGASDSAAAGDVSGGASQATSPTGRQRRRLTADTAVGLSQRLGEMDLVLQGIKHARVGVDSHEFKEIEGSLLLASTAALATGTFAGTLFPPPGPDSRGSHPASPPLLNAWAADAPATSPARHSGQQQQPHQLQQAWSESLLGRSSLQHHDSLQGRTSLQHQQPHHARTSLTPSDDPSAPQGAAPRPLSASAAQAPLVAPPVSLMPVTTAAWLRTLRSSATGALASLRMSREGSLQGRLSTTPPGGDLSVSGGPSPATSRPASSGTTHARDSAGSGSARPATAASHALQHSTSMTSARPGTSTASGIPRPFTGRPGTASFAAGGASSQPNSTANTPQHMAGGLYWRKHRIHSSASTSIAWGGGGGAGAADGVDEDEAGPEAGGAGSSALTYGGDSIGGSLARDLRRRRKGGAGAGAHPATAPAGSSIIAGAATAAAQRRLGPGSAGAAAGAAGGAGSRTGRGWQRGRRWGAGAYRHAVRRGAAVGGTPTVEAGGGGPRPSG